jgi:two-component system nitrogen regulation sensor histidine kinase NtrY
VTREADLRRRRRRLRQIAFITVLLALLAAAWLVRGDFSLRALLGLDGPADALTLYALSTLNFIAFVTLALVLVRHLLKLLRERREQRLGSKFKSRMVMGSIALTALPTAMLFLFSFFLIDTTIRIFLQPTQTIVSNARGVLSDSIEYEVDNLRASARGIARDNALQRAPAIDVAALRPGLDRQARRLRLAALELRERGGVVTSIDSEGAALAPIFAEEMAAARTATDAGQFYQGVARNSDDNGAIFMIVGVPIGAGQRNDVDRAMIVVRRFPPELAAKFVSIERQLAASEALVGQQGQIRKRYVATLSLVTLIVLFATIWIALYVSRSVTDPIQALVEATGEVAGGNFAHRIDAPAAGELKTLVDSFNAMAEQLGESRARLEERRAYIETVLASLTTGVVSLDASGRVTMVNGAAARMLDLGPGPYDLETLAAAVGPARAKFEALLRRARRSGAAAGEVAIRLHDGTEIPAAVSVSSLTGPDGAYSGAVVTVEDVSELVKAERVAAWNEVARRMAHEIKNPLTPIQLSAERISRGFRRDEVRESARFGAIVDECTATIVREVGALQHMVEEFSRYARMPQPRFEPGDLNEIVRTAAGFYEGRLDGVRLDLDLDESLPPLTLDPEQMRRVVVNLVDNALEAVASVDERRVSVSTRYDARAEAARLVVEDTGHGIDPADRDKLFLPHFSTRSRGTGLGLAIVRHIVSDHRGRIWIGPNAPQGARFTVELPVTVSSGQWAAVSGLATDV